MSSTILHPPSNLSPSVALQLSQQAPAILSQGPATASKFSLVSLFASTETAETWTTYENLMLSCLRTGDHQAARQCLEKLLGRFGAENERLMALRGLYEEAVAETDKDLALVLKEYDAILADNPSNVPISKRRIALLRSTGKVSEAISALVDFLQAFPTDGEAWAELSDLYVSIGAYQQSIFALEEVLLITPNAWNVHARLGEVLFMASAAGGDGAQSHLAESMRRFSRSIELCDNYLRGYYGLKITTDRILESPTKRSAKNDDAESLPDTKTVETLNELATAKLGEIVRRSVGREVGWEGYDPAELIATRELLDRGTTGKKF